MKHDEIKQIIIENLKTIAKFHEHPYAGKDLDTSKGDAGFLRCVFKLSDCRKWCDLREYQDDQILSSLDQLSSQRKIKIYMVSASRNLHHNDLWIKAEIGRATRRLQRFACAYEYPEIIHYFDEVLSKSEHAQGNMTIPRSARKLQRSASGEIGISKSNLAIKTLNWKES